MTARSSATDGSSTPRARSQPEDGYSRIQSVDRAVDLLELLAEAGGEGLSLATIADQLGTSKSTAHALLRTLSTRGLVSDIGARKTRRYRLGLALARLGDQVLSQISLLDIATPTLRALTDETEWTSRIGVLEEGYAVIVGRVEGPGVVRFRSNLARRELPHSTAIGKAILAYMAPEEVREIVARTGLPARTPKTITSVDDLLRTLARVRTRGFALDDEEDSLGVLCVGAPIFDYTSACVAAISVTGLKPAMRANGVERVADVVKRYAAELSHKLGASAGGDNPNGSSAR